MIQRQLSTIEEDLDIVKKELIPHADLMESLNSSSSSPSLSSSSSPSSSSLPSSTCTVSQEQQANVRTTFPSPVEQQESSSASQGSLHLQGVLANRKLRVYSNFEELLNGYVSSKVPVVEGKGARELYGIKYSVMIKY